MCKAVLHYDGGPWSRAGHDQAEIDHLGIARSPAYHDGPETHGCVEKFIQTRDVNERRVMGAPPTARRVRPARRSVRPRWMIATFTNHVSRSTRSGARVTSPSGDPRDNPCRRQGVVFVAASELHATRHSDPARGRLDEHAVPFAQAAARRPRFCVGGRPRGRRAEQKEYRLGG